MDLGCGCASQALVDEVGTEASAELRPPEQLQGPDVGTGALMGGLVWAVALLGCKVSGFRV